MSGLVKLLVVVLVAGVVAAELVAPTWVAARAEAAISESTDGRVGTQVEVSGPPLLIPFAVTSRVSSWEVQLTRVGATDVPLDVSLALSDITLDRARLLGGEVVVTAVEQGRVRVSADLSGQVPAPLQGLADELADAGAERLLEALDGSMGVAASEGSVRVGDLVLPVVPGSCRFTNENLVVTARCDLREIPDFLLAAVNSR